MCDTKRNACLPVCKTLHHAGGRKRSGLVTSLNFEFVEGDMTDTFPGAECRRPSLIGTNGFLFSESGDFSLMCRTTASLQNEISHKI